MVATIPGSTYGGVMWRYPIICDVAGHPYPSVDALMHPNGNPVTSPFGPRDTGIQGASKYHQGIDLVYSGSSAAKICAAADGTVANIAWQPGGAGQYVTITHGNGYATIYMHMVQGSPSGFISIGDYVKAGTQIGVMGTTGVSSGVHLHFGVSHNGVYFNPVEILGGSYTAVPTEAEKSPINRWYTPTLPNAYENIKGSNIKLLNYRRRDILSSYRYDLFGDYRKSDTMMGSGAFGCNTYGTYLFSADKEPFTKDWITDNILNTGSRINPGNFKRSAIGSRDIEVMIGEDKVTVNQRDVLVIYIAGYLINHGWTIEAASATVANMYWESGLNPQRWENDTVYQTPNNRRGYGLTGWTPWNKYTDKHLSNRADVFDPDKNDVIKDLDNQIDQVIADMTSGKQYFVRSTNADGDWNGNIESSTAYQTNQAGFRDFVDSYKNSSGVGYTFRISGKEYMKSHLSSEILSAVFMVNYEAPDKLSIDLRMNTAKEFFAIVSQQFKVRSEAPKEDDAYWSKDNPYKFGTNKNYAYGRASELLSTMEYSVNRLCAKDNKNWMSYNEDSLFYKVGRMPAPGAIMCWKDKSNNSYLAVVEMAPCTEVIYASEVDDSGNFKYEMRKNYDGNWGMDSSKYLFEGFIYLGGSTPVSSYINSETGKVAIECGLNGAPVVTLCCGVTDLRHFSSVTLSMDIDIKSPIEKKELGTASKGKRVEDSIENHLDAILYVSQQVLSVTDVPTADFNWNNVKKVSLKETSTEILDGPSPYGMAVLYNDVVRKIAALGKYKGDAKEFSVKDYRLEIPLNNLSTYFGEGCFDPNVPTYFCLMIMADDYKPEGKEWGESYIKVAVKEFTINR